MQGSTFLCTRIRSFSTRSAVIRIDYFVDHFLVPRTSVQLSCISISTFKKISFAIDAHFSLSCVFTSSCPSGPSSVTVIFGFYTVFGSDRIGHFTTGRRARGREARPPLEVRPFLSLSASGCCDDVHYAPYAVLSQDIFGNVRIQKFRLTCPFGPWNNLPLATKLVGLDA